MYLMISELEATGSVATFLLSNSSHSPDFGFKVCTYLHSSLLREVTTTEELLEEAKSLEESEEKQRRLAERSSLGSLDTWRTNRDAQKTQSEECSSSE